MTRNAPPNINPANNDTLAGAFAHIFDQFISNVNGMLPAQVIAYSPINGNIPATVQVQPLIMLVDTNGNQIPRAQIANVPVLQIGSGGFLINFPIKTGDLGWIMANDRDISQFLSTYAQAQPNTFRKNDFADSIFIPGVLKGYTIASEDTNNLTLQNLDGTVKISLGPEKIKLTAPTVEVNATTIVIDASGAVPNIVGNIFVDGFINSTGAITPYVPP